MTVFPSAENGEHKLSSRLIIISNDNSERAPEFEKNEMQLRGKLSHASIFSEWANYVEIVKRHWLIDRSHYWSESDSISDDKKVP